MTAYLIRPAVTSLVILIGISVFVFALLHGSADIALTRPG